MQHPKALRQDHAHLLQALKAPRAKVKGKRPRTEKAHRAFAAPSGLESTPQSGRIQRDKVENRRARAALKESKDKQRIDAAICAGVAEQLAICAASESSVTEQSERVESHRDMSRGPASDAAGNGIQISSNTRLLCFRGTRSCMSNHQDPMPGSCPAVSRLSVIIAALCVEQKGARCSQVDLYATYQQYTESHRLPDDEVLGKHKFNQCCRASFCTAAPRNKLHN